MMYIDPAGHAILAALGIMLVEGLIGSVVSAVSSAIVQSSNTGTVNWKSVAVAGGTGFVMELL